MSRLHFRGKATSPNGANSDTNQNVWLASKTWLGCGAAHIDSPEERLRSMNLYTPILVLGAIAAVFAVGSVGIALLVGPRRYNHSKLEAYECGIEPMDVSDPAVAATAQRFPIKYYLTAMLFIVFDIEIVFLYPWAVAFDSLGAFGVIAVALFLFNVSVAYAYEWRRGGLAWD